MIAVVGLPFLTAPIHSTAGKFFDIFPPHNAVTDHVPKTVEHSSESHNGIISYFLTSEEKDLPQYLNMYGILELIIHTTLNSQNIII